MRAAILACALLASVVPAVAQQASTAHPTVSSVLERMKSPRWAERARASYEAGELLVSTNESPDDVDKLRLGIIQLLIKENNGGLKEPDDGAKQGSTNSNGTGEANEGDGEEESDYYSGLIGFVADLNDKRAIPALLGAAGTGGMVTRGVARFGKKALNPTLAQVKSQNSDLANGAVFVILEMLKMHTVGDPDSHLRIKNALRSALASPEYRVRGAAIGAIEYLDDREEFVPILKGIAERDPYRLADQPDNDGKIRDVYFVREHASKLLRKIASHEPPVVDQGLSH
jgi:hypothetical protein